MKSNNNLLSGVIKSDDKTFDALALYFEKYVQAYRKEGINIFMVMPQNEPTERPNYPSCGWNGVQLRDFIKNHLGPKFSTDSVNCEIWLGTLTNPDYSYVSPTVDDPSALAFIKGIGFQWYGKTSCQRVQREHPEIPLMQSETMCGNGENNWHYAESQFDLMKTYFDYGVSYYMLWNMVLDQTGRSTNNWRQCSPIVVNKVTRNITYNPQYYIFKHFSYYIKPGANKITVSGNYDDTIAFMNPDGETVLELKNGRDKGVTVAIDFNGEEIKPTLPAHSVSTFRMAARAN
jgi:glucosylceramidase